MYKEGHKVTTPDDEQGFVSAVYADGIFDVDILDDNEEDTTSIEYHVSDGVHIEVDQQPKLRDVCPFGRVRGTLVFAEGIISVYVDGVSGYAAVWVSEERMAYLNGRLDLKFHHWVDIQDLDTLLEIFDLETDECGSVIFKGIRHYEIAEQCELEIMFADKHVEIWNAHVDGEGNILEVMPDKDGRPEKITTLAELRATGAIEITLVSRYDIKDF